MSRYNQIVLRSPTPADIEPCARILYNAFHDIATRHGFPPDFESAEQARQLIGMLIDSSLNGRGVFGVVAEQDGRVVGSNFLAEADPIAGVGPITVDPLLQGSGIGRKLMQAALERGRQAPGIRLVQDAFNARSLSLYTSLGFEVKEPLAMIQGRPRSSETRKYEGIATRPMEEADFAGCVALCRLLHRFDRASEVRHRGPLSRPWVAVRDGRITAYATAPHFWVLNHGVAESDEDLQALLTGFAASTAEPVWFLLPMRQASFFRWCLTAGLRVIKPMTLMAIGEYQEPLDSCWFPSVMY